MKNRDFLDRIGVTAKETFAPADIELEPDFDFVAEWQDYRVTSRLRLQDLLMDELFRWMDDYGYKFAPICRSSSSAPSASCRANSRTAPRI